ncbi:MAG: DUF1844 domain-containing protein [Armatimonadia bacterium]
MVDDREQQEPAEEAVTDTDEGHVEPSVEGIPMEADTASEAPDSHQHGAEPQMQFDTYGLLRLMLNMLAEQAWVEMGLRVPPGSTELKTDLKQARLAIDTLAYLKDALGDNLQVAEKRELDQLLATLRMNFVQRS